MKKERGLEKYQENIVVSFAVREYIVERRSNEECPDQESMSFGQRMFSRLSDWWQSGHKYTHCEISFLPKDTSPNAKCLTFAVFSNRSDAAVVKMYRAFNQIYEHKTLPIKKSRMKEVHEFLENQVGKSFDYWGSMFGTFWSGNFNYERANWYCCSLTVTALQKAGYLYGVRPNCIEIDELHDILEYDTEIVTRMVPYQRMQFDSALQQINLKKKSETPKKHKKKNQK